MPRKPIIRSNEHYYHITARSNNKEDFYLPLPDLWQVFTGGLGSLQKEFKIQICAFVLMHNHFHLLIMTPDEDIDRIMYFFMKKTTLEIQKRTGRINKIFGGRYKGSIIENHQYLLNVYKYIYRNPVAAGICQRAEDYEFSTLFSGIHERKQFFNLESVFEGPQLEWINQSFKEREAQSIQLGLRKTIFEYKKERISRKEICPT
ncbi:MAG: transposase [Bacteriovoracia bacterium]